MMRLSSSSLACARKLTAQHLQKYPGTCVGHLASLPPSKLEYALLGLFSQLDTAGNLLCSEALTKQDLDPQALARVVDMLGAATLVTST